MTVWASPARELGKIHRAWRHWQQALDIFAALGIDESEETNAIRATLAEIGQPTDAPGHIDGE